MSHLSYWAELIPGCLREVITGPLSPQEVHHKECQVGEHGHGAGQPDHNVTKEVDLSLVVSINKIKRMNSTTHNIFSEWNIKWK